MLNSLPDSQFFEAITQLKVGVVILSLAMVARIPETIEKIDKIRELDPDITVIGGGRGTAHAKSVFAKHKCLVIDNFYDVLKAAGKRDTDA